MGICSGKPKQIVVYKIKSISSQKSSIEQRKNRVSVNFNEFKIDWTADKEQIIESLLSEGMLFKLGLHQDIDDILCIPNDYQNSNLLDIALKISIKIKDTENKVDKIQSKTATIIMSNFKNKIIDQVQELSGKNLQLLKNNGIPMDCLTLSIFTYHVLMHYIQERNNAFFNEEIIESQLLDRFNFLQGRMSMEMINCYGNQNKQREKYNPMEVFDSKISSQLPQNQSTCSPNFDDDKMKDEKIKDEKMNYDIKAVMDDLLEQIILQDSLEQAFQSLNDMYDGSIENKVNNLKLNSLRTHTVKFSRQRID